MNPPFRRPALLPALLASLVLPAMGLAQEGKGPKRWIGDKDQRERIEAWETLSPEQRDKLRQALRDVWTDPAVINAREEVKHASEAYQAAIRAAVERVDPSVAGLLAKVQGPGGPVGAPVSGGPNSSGPGFRRGFDEQIPPPGFLESLSPEMRETYRRAETSAMETERVRAAKSALGKIRDEDEALRRRRLEAHRQLRKAIVEEMVRSEPALADHQKRLLEAGRKGVPAPGSGPPVRREGEPRGGKDGDKPDREESKRKDGKDGK